MAYLLLVGINCPTCQKLIGWKYKTCEMWLFDYAVFGFSVRWDGSPWDVE
jgi:hypothetical protein